MHIHLSETARRRYELIARELGRPVVELVTAAAEEEALKFFRYRTDDPGAEPAKSIEPPAEPINPQHWRIKYPMGKSAEGSDFEKILEVRERYLDHSTGGEIMIMVYYGFELPGAELVRR